VEHFHANNNFTGSGDKADRWISSGPATSSPLEFHSLLLGRSKTGLSCSHNPDISAGYPTFYVAYAKCTRVTPTRYAFGGWLLRGRQLGYGSSQAGTFGTMAGTSSATRFQNVDFSVFKTFTFKERYSAQFRVEFFNLFNHPIIANPTRIECGNSGDDARAARVWLRVQHTRCRSRQSDHRRKRRAMQLG